jgi:glycosyltransferase involved in cell wall biosynthesis
MSGSNGGRGGGETAIARFGTTNGRFLVRGAPGNIIPCRSTLANGAGAGSVRFARLVAFSLSHQMSERVRHRTRHVEEGLSLTMVAVGSATELGLPAPPARRLWIISELYWPEPTSTGYFLTGIAEGLADARTVHVICAQPTYRLRGHRSPRSEVRHGVHITRVRSTTLDPHFLPSRLLNMLTFAIGTAVALVRGVASGDEVLVVTNPPLLPYLVAVLSRLRGFDASVLVHDVYPQILAATGFLSPTNVFYRGLSRAARAMYRGMRQIIVLGRDMEHVIAQQVGPTPAPIVIIPNWGEVDEIRPIPKRDIARAELAPFRERFVLQCLGHIGRTHDAPLLTSLASGQDFEGAIDWLFVGGGRAIAETSRAAGGAAHHLPSCAADALADYLAVGDLAVIAYRPGMAGLSVPSRLYNVMSAGRPVLAIADDDSEVARVVREEDIGWVVRPGDRAGAVAAIRSALEDPVRLAAMGARARAAAERAYGRQTIVEAYRTLFESPRTDA